MPQIMNLDNGTLFYTHHNEERTLLEEEEDKHGYNMGNTIIFLEQ
jgi:hypothetical protein